MTTATQTKNWQKTQLGDFVVFNYGKGLPERDRVAGPYPVYGSAGVVDTNKDYLVEGPGIVVGRKGSVGEIYYTDKNYFPIDTVYYITKGDKYNLRFLYYLLKTIDFKSLNSDAAVPGLNRNTAYAQEVLLPKTETQKQIADVLSAYDDMIENNTKRIKILEQIAQAIYREWFVYFRFPGHEKVKMVDSKTEFGKIPEEWRVKTTADVFDAIGGGTPSKVKEEYWINGKIEWFTPSDLTSQRNVFALHSQTKISADGLRNSSAKLFPAGSVMMTSRATIGEIAISTYEATTNQGFITCIPRDDCFSSFQIYFWLKENKELFKLLSGGATFKEITKSTFRKILLVVPESSVAKQFNRIVAPLFEEILNLQKQLIQLRQARDLLLPKLVSGEINVTK